MPTWRWRKWWWGTGAFLLLLLLGLTYLVERSRVRLVKETPDLFRLLPPTAGSDFFADVASLRRAGYLQYLSVSAQEPDYISFVQQTGFDYARDVDAIAGVASEDRIFFALRGRMDWDKVHRYIETHGGTCNGELCSMPSVSTPGRYIGVVLVQADVLGVAVAFDKSAAEVLRHLQRAPAPMPSAQPVWIRLSPALTANPAQMPKAFQIFAISLQSAHWVVLSLTPPLTSSAAFGIRLDASFENAPAAATAKGQLDLNTRMLKLEMAREQASLQPGDLAELLLSGTFQVNGKGLSGSWPVQKALLERLH